MIDLIAGIFVLSGATFCLIAAIGMVRFPDLYVRMHAATKAGTLGVGLALMAVVVFGAVSGDLGTVLRALAALLFVLLTAPIGAHLLARAAYATGVEMWHKSEVDDLRGKYDFSRDVLIGDGGATDEASEDRS